MRYRPQFTRKEDENWDVWYRELAPSKNLHRDYMKLKIIDWNEYVRRFTSEMTNNPESMAMIYWLSEIEDNKNEVVTLLCQCKDDNKCHRSLIKQLASNIK
jgi:uncharacterized protein YeaO (DUF488 family)